MRAESKKVPVVLTDIKESLEKSLGLNMKDEIELVVKNFDKMLG